MCSSTCTNTHQPVGYNVVRLFPSFFCRVYCVGFSFGNHILLEWCLKRQAQPPPLPSPCSMSDCSPSPFCCGAKFVTSCLAAHKNVTPVIVTCIVSRLWIMCDAEERVVAQTRSRYYQFPSCLGVSFVLHRTVYFRLIICALNFMRVMIILSIILSS